MTTADAAIGGQRLEQPREVAAYTRAFVFLALAHVVVWTALPSLFFTSFPLDVIEGLTWGHEWQLGYYKHPPLQAWLLAGAMRIGPVAVNALGPLAAAAAFWFVWEFARQTLGSARAAFWSVALLAVTYPFTLALPEFNPNVLQLPFWAMLGWAMQRALATGRLRFWLLCGVAAALGLLAKYFMAVALAALALLLLVHPAGRRALRTPGPWAGLLLALALLAPHLIWLADSDWQPIEYAARRSGAADGWRPITAPLKFAADQFLMLLGVILVALAWRVWRCRPFGLLKVADRDDALLIALTIGPLAICVAGAVVVPLRTAWGVPMGCFAGVLAMRLMPAALTLRSDRRLVRGWAPLAALPPIAFLGISAIYPLVHARPIRTLWPAATLATRVTQAWHEETGEPLALVRGTVWVAGMVAAYSPDHPTVWIEPIAGEPVSASITSPWITPQTAACRGIALVWRGDLAASPVLPSIYRDQFPDVALQRRLELMAGRRPLAIDWAIVRPSRRDCPR